MAEALQRVFGAFLVLFGISSLVGWSTAFRNRLYLAPMGVAFIVAGGATLLAGKEMAGLRIALLAVAGVIFLVGVWLAVREVRRELQGIREQRRGLERQMEEYLNTLEAKQGKTEESE